MLDTGATGTNLQVTGNASFAEESKLALKLSSIEQAEGQHVVLTAGTLTGADKLTASQTLLTFLYKGTLTSNATQLIVDVSRKRSEEHTSELQSLMRNSYAVFCLKTKTTHYINYQKENTTKS